MAKWSPLVGFWRRLQMPSPRSKARGLVAAFVEKVESDPNFKVNGSSDDLYERGLRLYSTRSDKRLVSYRFLQRDGKGELTQEFFAQPFDTVRWSESPLFSVRQRKRHRDHRPTRRRDRNELVV